MSSGPSGEADAWPWPAPEDDGAADHLKPGTPVPKLGLFCTAARFVNFTEMLRPAVVFVYPFMGGPARPNPQGWDDIPGAHGSTPQAVAYSRQIGRFSALGYDVHGISMQRFGDQLGSYRRLRLNFPLIHDPGDFSGALALPSFEADGQRFLRRLTLIIGDGVIKRTLYPVHPPPRDAEQVLSILSQTTSE
ncbi:MAG: peroxiredoxin [Pseudomonadota bacterium]